MTSEALFRAIEEGSIDARYEEVPYGILYCTGGNHPRILYMNELMKSFIGFSGDSEGIEPLFDDIYLSIPYLERKTFAKDLLEAEKSSVLIPVTHIFTRTDGRNFRLSGKMKVQKGTEPGDVIFKITYQPVEEKAVQESPAFAGPVLNALENAYDVVIRLDRKNNYCELVKCSGFKNEKMYRGLKVLLNRSLDNLVEGIVHEEDRKSLRSLIDSISSDEKQQDCTFRFQNDTYYCTYVRFSSREVYICCKLLSEKPEENPAEEPAEPLSTLGEREIRARMFGYFDLFVDGKAVPFKNKKAKELLALLISRNGGFVSPDEIVGCLWENESVNKSTLARIRKTFFSLTQELREYGIEGILESSGSARRVIPEKISCDLYRYLEGEKGTVRPDTFLRNYAWGEYIADDVIGG